MLAFSNCLKSMKLKFDFYLLWSFAKKVDFHLINNPRMSWRTHTAIHGQTILTNWKIYFTEVSQISIRINMGMIFLTSEVMEAVRGQKHPSDVENGMKESIYWKKCLMKVSQQPQKPTDGSNQIWATNSGKKDTWATSEVTV